MVNKILLAICTATVMAASAAVSAAAIKWLNDKLGEDGKKRLSP